MNVSVLVASVGAVVVVAAVAMRPRRRRRRVVPLSMLELEQPRVKPMPHVEKALGEGIFASIRRSYANFGDIFAGFSVFRIGAAVRMELATKPDWMNVTAMYRGLALRGIWRALQKQTGAQDVAIYVDRGSPDAEEWTAAKTETFKDRGTPEPWATAGGGNVGTLVSRAPLRTSRPNQAPLRLRDRRRL